MLKILCSDLKLLDFGASIYFLIFDIKLSNQVCSIGRVVYNISFLNNKKVIVYFTFYQLLTVIVDDIEKVNLFFYYYTGTTNVIKQGGGYAWINFALPFTQVCEYTATVQRTDANGSGCDVIYCDVELGRIRIQHDFASTANMVWFNWSVTGFWK
ncbi:Hypothetical_protein [Hexamita inflata]|uniref:Hypothetical_protein n=1 Tax=Hexamita inflata TaxID=28002 RepID=A0AA86Q346_9EUKA|nr:Hypothetical protein HINF_LOCUS32259 [Hexamita inflata]